MADNDYTPTSSLSVTHRLPCGHTVSQECASLTDADPEWFSHAAAVLDFWVKDRELRHECALVGPDNPHGVPRRKVASQGAA